MKNSLCIRLSLNIGSNVCFFKKFDHFSWCDDKMLSWKMLDVSCHEERTFFGQRYFIKDNIL